MTDDLITKTENERIDKILALSDEMIKKVEKALKEIDKTTIKIKERKKEVKYDEELKKPVSEVYTESEKNKTVSSLVDTQNLKQLASTLKELKEIQASILDGSNQDEGGGLIEISKRLDEVMENWM